MTLIDAILLKAKSVEDDQRSDKKYLSPPPELSELKIVTKQTKKIVPKFANVPARVNTSPPILNTTRWYRNLAHWRKDHVTLFNENLRLMMIIKKAQLLKGRVDNHWKTTPHRSQQYFRNRVDFYKRVQKNNQNMYQMLTRARSRVIPTAVLNRDWSNNRRKIVLRARNTFVLFPPMPQEELEDSAFAAPPGVRRPRVYMTIGFKGCAVMGELAIELFTDICPATCRLFIELLQGDTLGHSYVGTCFFRKVPYLYWSGGDVIHNNGFGCYAQRGRTKPIGAENYHFSHSIPGLLSMRVTCDDEMCGLFNITFKPLPQFDLHNVVFGRIIRPSITYDTIRVVGRALSSYPIIEVRSTRTKRNGVWVPGEPNTRLVTSTEKYVRLSLVRQR